MFDFETCLGRNATLTFYLSMQSQRHIRVYNLLKQELTKKLMTGAKWVSSMAIHPGKLSKYFVVLL